MCHCRLKADEVFRCTTPTVGMEVFKEVGRCHTVEVGGGVFKVFVVDLGNGIMDEFRCIFFHHSEGGLIGQASVVRRLHLPATGRALSRMVRL